MKGKPYEVYIIVQERNVGITDSCIYISFPILNP